jgi:hypothetical protein
MPGIRLVRFGAHGETAADRFPARTRSRPSTIRTCEAAEDVVPVHPGATSLCAGAFRAGQNVAAAPAGVPIALLGGFALLAAPEWSVSFIT